MAGAKWKVKQKIGLTYGAEVKFPWTDDLGANHPKSFKLSANK